MAIDFSKYNFFSRLDARARIFVLIAVVFGIILTIYLLTRLFFGGENTTGPSRVAGAPPGVQSVPGGQLTPEYQRALEQANLQQAQQAQMHGTSAIPTAINYGVPQGPSAGCIICAEESTNIKDFLDDWLKQGKINPDVAAALQALANKNVPVEDFAALLDRLLREGKLTPEQARQLLEQYKKQHANAQLKESAALMDNLIKNNQLPIDAANALLDAQKRRVSPSDYAAMLQDLVRQGKISPEVAQQLLAQYAQQRAREIVQQSIALLRTMSGRGEITPDVLSELIDYESRLIPMDAFATALQRYVAAGKLTPAVASRIQKEYADQKAAIGPSGTLNDLIRQAEAAAYQELSDLVAAGKITQETAQQIAGMIQNNVSMADFQAAIERMVAQQKLTPEIAKLKIADYQKIKDLRDLAQRLANLQGNNAAPGLYADELKRAVAAGLMTPEQAAELMRQYQALSAPITAPVTAGGGATPAFAALQQRVQEGTATGAPVAGAAEFNVAKVAAQENVGQDRQARIDALVAAMQAQAGQLINAWQPPTMQNRTGSYDPCKKEKECGKGAATGASASTKETEKNVTGGGVQGAPLIKAGTLMFAVLDTEANSDYPNTPIMATIVQGPYKGAKLLGKLTTEKNVAGQLDRISLTFTLMNMDQWPTSKGVTAYAIDPDTARTVMASRVDHHYLLRYGLPMAFSFVQGLASAVQNSASTTTTGIFGTSTTRPTFSSSEKNQIGLGQIGQNLGSALQNYTNLPPTVRVDPGVGLGILFMSDVT